MPERRCRCSVSDGPRASRKRAGIEGFRSIVNKNFLRNEQESQDLI
jgi:hypothetical protein